MIQARLFDKERASWSRGMISALGAEGLGLAGIGKMCTAPIDPRRSPLFFCGAQMVEDKGGFTFLFVAYALLCSPMLSPGGAASPSAEHHAPNMGSNDFKLNTDYALPKQDVSLTK